MKKIDCEGKDFEVGDAVYFLDIKRNVLMGELKSKGLSEPSYYTDECHPIAIISHLLPYGSVDTHEMPWSCTYKSVDDARREIIGDMEQDIKSIDCRRGLMADDISRLEDEIRGIRSLIEQVL